MVPDLVEAAKQLATSDLEQQKKMLDFLYGALTILDGKAAALMGFDVIMVAAAAFLIEKSVVPGVHRLRRVAAILVVLLALLGAALSLWVARVDYNFLGAATLSSDGKLILDAEFKALAAAIADRTREYQYAWKFSLAAVCLSGLIALTFVRWSAIVSAIQGHSRGGKHPTATPSNKPLRPPATPAE
jgi:hypothetical protein